MDGMEHARHRPVARLPCPRQEQHMELTGTTTIRKPPPDVFAFWRHFDNLPRFMAHVDDVRLTGERTSHWVVSAPFGRDVEWDAEMTEEITDQQIAWRSTE